MQTDWLAERIVSVANEAVRGTVAVAAGVSEAPRQVCARCRAEWPTDAMQCASCGVGLTPLVPLTVRCGFCEAPNRRDLVAHCAGCGGPLPGLPGGIPGPMPPPPPRALPPLLNERGRRARSLSRTLGVVFVVVGLPFVLVGIGLLFVGLGLWFGLRPELRAWTRRTALERGHATRGTLVRVDVSQIHADGDVWRQYALVYEFEASGRHYRGTCVGHDDAHALRRPGDELWVVHVPGQSRLRSAIWPPVC